MMDATSIVDALARALPGESARFQAVESQDGMPTVVVAPDAIVDVGRVLRDDPALRFVLLLDIVAIDFYPRDPRFELSYLLVRPGAGGYGETPARLRVKVHVGGEDPRLPSVCEIWGAANWAEREVFDFYGVRFEGHPDLRRILMPEDWEGYPMRKDYPVQIRQAVKTTWPLQVSEQEFVANIEAARSRGRAD